MLTIVNESHMANANKVTTVIARDDQYERPFNSKKIEKTTVELNVGDVGIIIGSHDNSLMVVMKFTRLPGLEVYVYLDKISEIDEHKNREVQSDIALAETLRDKLFYLFPPERFTKPEWQRFTKPEWRLAGNKNDVRYNKESSEVEVTCSNGITTKTVSINYIKTQNPYLLRGGKKINHKSKSKKINHKSKSKKINHKSKKINHKSKKYT